MEIATSLRRWTTPGPLALMFTRSPNAQLASQRVPKQQRLARHATLRLPNHESVLQVISGCVWVTRDGSATDWVLEAGQVFMQQAGAPVLVHALRDAHLVIARGHACEQNG
jgi:quercetin dioxygenase-like cupin family protein